MNGMKTLIASVMFIVLLCSCVNKNNNNIPTQTQQTSTKFESKESTYNPTHAMPITNSTPSGSIEQDPFEIIHQLLSLKWSDALKMAKLDDSECRTTRMESHMPFPCVFVEDIKITIIYGNAFDDYPPLALLLQSDTRNDLLNAIKAKPDMKFEEIKKLMGDQEVRKTWISSEDSTAYELAYVINGLKFSFQSYEEDGEASGLYISIE
jgi:hypothetical protein